MEFTVQSAWYLMPGFGISDVELSSSTYAKVKYISYCVPLQAMNI
jgi:hypothetical protein